MTESATAPYKSSMVMRNDPGEVGKLTQWIIETCAAAHIPEKTSFAVQLCLDEAVANILQHAEQHAEQHRQEDGARASAISASLERGDAGVWLDIEDDGEAFDPTRRRRCGRRHRRSNCCRSAGASASTSCSAIFLPHGIQPQRRPAIRLRLTFTAP